jgi:hypothetical protein
MPPENFAVFILTHGRPDSVVTYKTLQASGYTGKVYIIIDDEDSDADRYRENFGDKVIQFNKREIAKVIDQGDNFDDRRAIVYARNACFKIAEDLGIEYFLQLDDDYKEFVFTADASGHYLPKKIKDLDSVFEAILKFYSSTPFHSVAMAQGGDFIGGKNNNSAAKGHRRKVMNTFFCSTRRPFAFLGRMNEDVTTYTLGASRGLIFLTLTMVRIGQIQSQSLQGGMTDAYMESGTYVKSAYSLMYMPSAVKISRMPSAVEQRIHHNVTFKNCTPQIIREQHRKAD